MATVTTIDRREQFLEKRRKFVGGSDAASLFPEDSKYGCPRRLVYDKRGVPPDYERTEREKSILERGTELEDMIADKFTRDYGLKIRRTPSLVNKDKAFIGVNMDRQIVAATTEQIKSLWPELELEGECGPGYLECKSSNPYDFKRLVNEGVIPDYIFQVQHGLGVRGYKWGVLAVLDTTSFEMRVFPFTANAVLIAEIQYRAEQLWAIVTEPEAALPNLPTFPDGTKRCRGCVYRRSCLGAAALLAMAGEKPDTEYVSDDSFAEVLTDYKEIDQQIDALEFVKDQIKEKIQAEMSAKTYTKLEVPSIGMRVNWTETKPRVSWDTKALEAEAGTIGRKVAFADFVGETHPDLVVEFQKKEPSSTSLADKYKRPGAPTRPFKVTSL